jgi:hypothetical protein
MKSLASWKFLDTAGRRQLVRDAIERGLDVTAVAAEAGVPRRIVERMVECTPEPVSDVEPFAAWKFISTVHRRDLLRRATAGGFTAEDMAARARVPVEELLAVAEIAPPIVVTRRPSEPVEVVGSDVVEQPKPKRRRKTRRREPVVPTAYTREVRAAVVRDGFEVEPAVVEDMVEIGLHQYVNRRSATELGLIAHERDEEIAAPIEVAA